MSNITVNYTGRTLKKTFYFLQSFGGTLLQWGKKNYPSNIFPFPDPDEVQGAVPYIHESPEK